jgi:hypothetical protein
MKSRIMKVEVNRQVEEGERWTITKARRILYIDDTIDAMVAISALMKEGVPRGRQ